MVVVNTQILLSFSCFWHFSGRKRGQCIVKQKRQGLASAYCIAIAFLVNLKQSCRGSFSGTPNQIHVSRPSLCQMKVQGKICPLPHPGYLHSVGLPTGLLLVWMMVNYHFDVVYGWDMSSTWWFMKLSGCEGRSGGTW